MRIILEAESMLTDHHPAAVPAAVRQAQRLRKRDTIRFAGEAVLSHAAQQDDDPVLAAFLDFLAHDMAAHTERLRPLDAELAQRLHALVDGVEVDLEAPLASHVDL